MKALFVLYSVLTLSSQTAQALGTSFSIDCAGKFKEINLEMHRAEDDDSKSNFLTIKRKKGGVVRLELVEERFDSGIGKPDSYRIYGNKELAVRISSLEFSDGKVVDRDGSDCLTIQTTQTYKNKISVVGLSKRPMEFTMFCREVTVERGGDPSCN